MALYREQLGTTNARIELMVKICKNVEKSITVLTSKQTTTAFYTVDNVILLVGAGSGVRAKIYPYTF